MATVTDITGSSITQVDLTSVQVGKDSNINVYEFGNVLLAGILPTISSWLKNISDFSGSSLSLSDQSGASLSMTDQAGSSNSLVDISGS